MRALAWWVIIYSCLTSLRALAAEPRVEIFCPAVFADDHETVPHAHHGSYAPVVLIAKGRVRNVTREGEPVERGLVGIGKGEFVVERLFFGSPPTGPIPVTVRTDELAQNASTVSDIYELTSARWDGQSHFTLRTANFAHPSQAALEEQWCDSLGEAHLDMLVAPCTSIFVGRPTAEKKSPHGSGVVVERVLRGARKSGEVVIQAGKETLPSPVVSQGPFLYFVSEEEDNGAGEIVQVETIWSADAIAAVEASLARCRAYPIVATRNSHGKEVRRQEVLFRGTRAEAIEMLGANSDTIQFLGSRRIVAEGGATIPDLVKRIEADLFRMGQPEKDHFVGQHNRIDLLAHLENHRTDGEVVRLIHRMLAAAERGAEFPQDPRTKRDPHAFNTYDDLFNTSQNHSLAWLIFSLDHRDAARIYRDRLLKLRDISQYGWKDEAQGILDLFPRFLSHVETSIERESARVPVVRWQGQRADVLPGIGGYAFSPDGKWLAISGRRIFILQTSDWSQVASFDPGGAGVHVFSPDGLSLYLSGAQHDDSFSRWDWRTGKVLQRYGINGETGSPVLSPDGTQILVRSYRGGRGALLTFDVASGKVLKRFPRGLWSDLHFSPDGQFLLVAGNPDQEEYNTGERYDPWHLVRWSDQQIEKIPFFPDPPQWAGPDLLWSMKKEPDPHSNVNRPSTNILQKRRVSAGYRLEAELKLDHQYTWFLVSRDGSTIALQGERRVTAINAAGKQLADWEFPEHEDSHWPHINSISPDGRYLIFQYGYDYPQLADTRTGKLRPLGATHSADAVVATFSADGRELTTTDWAGNRCRWNADNGRLLERTKVATPNRKDFAKPKTLHEYRAGDNELWTLRENTEFSSSRVIGIQLRCTNAEHPSPGRLIGEIPVDHYSPPFGFVPGGEFVHIGPQIYDRRTFKPRSETDVAGGHLWSMEFSADGSRFAIITEGYDRITYLADDNPGRHHDQRFRLWVYDTRSGKVLFGQLLRDLPHVYELSADGTRLAAVAKDNEISVWTLPK